MASKTYHKVSLGSPNKGSNCEGKIIISMQEKQAMPYQYSISLYKEL